jgi:hypothetical protein
MINEKGASRTRQMRPSTQRQYACGALRNTTPLAGRAGPVCSERADSSFREHLVFCHSRSVQPRRMRGSIRA